jgi:DNA-binding LacI/PurR family transcriptional regulator
LPGTLARRGIAVVCSGRPMFPPETPVPYVDVDHLGGVTAAIRHLLGTGRRRIATIAGPQDMIAGVDRLNGYRAAMRKAGLGQQVAFGDFTRDSGVRAMRQLLAEDPDVDGVFVASDMMAHGALQALKDAGRRVPADVAVVGFDDFEISRYSDPPLTTVRQPIPEIGRTMAHLILDLIDGKPDVPESVVLPTRLVVRASA